MFSRVRSAVHGSRAVPSGTGPRTTIESTCNPRSLPYRLSPLTLAAMSVGLTTFALPAWPGASATAPHQWPGWMQLADGTYVETSGNYAWTRAAAGVTVRFDVNPTYTTTVFYPAESTLCANPANPGPASVPGTTALPGPVASPRVDPVSSATMAWVFEPPPSIPTTICVMSFALRELGG